MNKLSLALFTLTSVLLATEPPKPLIEKTSGGGGTPPEYQRFERCFVYQDYVEVVHSYGTNNRVILNERRNVAISGNLQALISQAAQEKLESTPNLLCDAPTTQTASRGVLLFSTGGCGTPKRERQGFASMRLKEIINLYCPTTYGNH